MTDKKKPQLTDEQRDQLKPLVLAAVREKLSQRDKLQADAALHRQVWQALLEAPQWRIAHLEKPDNAPSADEIWSMTPTVTKR